jgi:DNA-binding HxlR family transcriptional regulator
LATAAAAMKAQKMDLRLDPGGPSVDRRMKGYGQFCPVAKAAEIFAERWTPLVLRELVCGSHRFSDLHRGLPLMSRTLLAQRLRQLEGAGVVRCSAKAHGRGQEYFLTPAGEELRTLIDGLGEWGQRWARSQMHPGDLDPGLLMWDIHRRVHVTRLPPRRVVVQFEFHGVPKPWQTARWFWLILDRASVDLCLKDPGYEVDLRVEADLATLTKVWMGDMRFGDALRAQLVRLDGPASLVRAFPGWLALSEFAGVARP